MIRHVRGPLSFGAIMHVMGTLLLVIAAAMILPAVCSLLYGREGDLLPILCSAGITFAVGLPMRWLFHRDREPGFKDAFVIATLGWVLVSAVSALPFVIHGSIPSFTDAFFEMMSGYTTTGATILEDIESVPHGLLFWRSETHLLGGMGFLTLAIMFLPQGTGGLWIFRAESSPGQVITKERFTARNRDAIAYLWLIYLGLNALQVILQCLGGMTLYDSLCHAFGTISTSGYSPYNAGMAHYDSAYLHWVMAVFMFLGGMSFMLLFQILRRQWRAVRINTELRWYLGIVLFFCGAVSLILWKHGTYGALDSLRHGTFQVMSLMTTTGYTTADYETWPNAARMFLYLVCFIGPCAGSTGSGIKVVHLVILGKFVIGTVRKLLIRPLSVLSIRINGIPVDGSVTSIAVCYFIINIILVLGGGCVMTVVDDMDFSSAMSSVVSTLMNIGPGFGAVGPSRNYAHVSDAGKWLLSWMMLVGRLDVFTAVVLIYPSFWRR